MVNGLVLIEHFPVCLSIQSALNNPFIQALLTHIHSEIAISAEEPVHIGRPGTPVLFALTDTCL